MESFIYTTNPSHVIFGPGSSSKLPDQLAGRNLLSALILSTPRQLEKATMIEQLLTPNTVGIFSRATMHTPVQITQEAVQAAKDLKADSIVSIGVEVPLGLARLLVSVLAFHIFVFLQRTLAVK
jgi:alcohol dehydrogenase class IV